VNNNFYQGFTNRAGTITLTPGFHNIDMGMFQGGGGAGFSAYIQFAGGAQNPITNAMLNEFVSTNPITLSANSTIDPSGSGALLGQLGMAPDLTLTTAAGSVSFAGTTFQAGSGTYNFNAAAASFVAPGPITDSSGVAGVTINKSGAGDLVFDNLSTAQLNKGGSAYNINVSGGSVVAVSSNTAAFNPLGNAVVNLSDGTGFGVSSQAGDVSVSNTINVATLANVNVFAGLVGSGVATGVNAAISNLNLGVGSTVSTSSTNNYNLVLSHITGSNTASLTHTGGTATLSGTGVSLNNIGVTFGKLVLASNTVTASGNLSTSGQAVLGINSAGTVAINAGQVLNDGAIHVTSGTATFGAPIGSARSLSNGTPGMLTESYFTPPSIGQANYYGAPDSAIFLQNQTTFATATPGLTQTFGDALSLTGAQVNTRVGNLFIDYNNTNTHPVTDNQSALYYGTITVGGNSLLQPGNISFGLNSDDGSTIYIDKDRDGVFSAGDLVVNEAGAHGTNNINGTGATGLVNLQPGVYRIAIAWYNGAGGSSIEARFANGDNGTGGAIAYTTQNILTPSANPTTFSSGTLGAGLSVDAGSTLSAPSATADLLTLNGVNATAKFTGATLTTIGDLAVTPDTSNNAPVGTVQVANSASFNSLAVSANGTLHKTGAGVMTVLTSSLMDTGATVQVDAGTLLFNGSAGTAGTTARGTFVANTGGQLGGIGMTPAIMVNGGKLAPGVNGEAPISVDGALSLFGSSTLSIVIAGDTPGSYGQVNLVDPTSGVTLDGSNSVHLTLSLSNYSPILADVFFLVTRLDGGTYGGATFNSLPNGAQVSLGNGFTGTISYTANHLTGLTTGGDDIAVFNVVPEPGTVATLLGGMGTLMGLQRFRRRKE